MLLSLLRNRLVYLLPLLLFFLFVLYLSLALRKDPRYVPLGIVSGPVPEFTLEPLYPTESPFSHHDLLGKAYVVNVFASWCVPCLAEHEVLMSLSHERGILIYGINYRDSLDDARMWLRQHGTPYTKVGRDPEGKAAIAWGIVGVPETFVVDKHGWVRYKYSGPLSLEEVQQNLLPLLESL